jgi:hypothetical protein
LITKLLAKYLYFKNVLKFNFLYSNSVLYRNIISGEKLNGNDLGTVQSMMSDNFVFSGPVPEPLKKQEYMGFLKGNFKAFSEFKYNHSNFKESGEQCTCNVKVSGKHTGELEVPGMNPIPATNKSFELPTESVVATFEGDKISKLESQGHPEGGIKGIIKQITS